MVGRGWGWGATAVRHSQNLRSRRVNTPHPRPLPTTRKSARGGRGAKRRVGGHSRYREFRDVCVLRHQPRDATQPEAGAQAIDQMRELRGMVGCGKSGLRRIAALARERTKTNDVKTEAGIAGIADGSEAFGEQRTHA